jgi:hypothetical protein
MMSVDIMMSLIFRCRHHDECEHNDGRVEPYLSTKVSHTLLTYFPSAVTEKTNFNPQAHVNSKIAEQLPQPMKHQHFNFFGSSIFWKL